jgi:LPXTG-motif cell wall-anchored protein
VNTPVSLGSNTTNTGSNDWTTVAIAGLIGTGVYLSTRKKG